ncbi:unnamed protein product [Gordionus sp. m RMFG-2023]
MNTFLFGNKYTVRKPPPRRSKILSQHADIYNKYLNSETLPENDFKIKLGNKEFMLSNHKWKINNLENNKEEDENVEAMNLKIKNEILLNMLTQLSAEFQFIEQEIKKNSKNI